MLGQPRGAVQSRRTDVLRPASALQAARITRLFLRFCWTQGWIDWVPDVSNRSCASGSPSTSVTEVPAILDEILLGDSMDEGESIARVRSTVAFTFWCALKPRELSLLRLSHLAIRPDGLCEVAIPGRASTAYAPSVALRQWHSYRVCREASARAQPPIDPPLISRISSYEPLGAHGIWHILKQWPGSLGSCDDVTPLGAKVVRDSCVALSSIEILADIQCIKAQTARRRVPIPMSTHE